MANENLNIRVNLDDNATQKLRRLGTTTSNFSRAASRNFSRVSDGLSDLTKKAAAFAATFVTAQAAIGKIKKLAEEDIEINLRTAQLDLALDKADELDRKLRKVSSGYNLNVEGRGGAARAAIGDSARFKIGQRIRRDNPGITGEEFDKLLEKQLSAFIVASEKIEARLSAGLGKRTKEERALVGEIIADVMSAGNMGKDQASLDRVARLLENVVLEGGYNLESLQQLPEALSLFSRVMDVSVEEATSMILGMKNDLPDEGAVKSFFTQAINKIANPNEQMRGLMKSLYGTEDPKEAQKLAGGFQQLMRDLIAEADKRGPLMVKEMLGSEELVGRARVFAGSQGVDLNSTGAQERFNKLVERQMNTIPAKFDTLANKFDIFTRTFKDEFIDRFTQYTSTMDNFFSDAGLATIGKSLGSLTAFVTANLGHLAGIFGRAVAILGVLGDLLGGAVIDVLVGISKGIYHLAGVVGNGLGMVAAKMGVGDRNKYDQAFAESMRAMKAGFGQINDSFEKPLTADGKPVMVVMTDKYGKPVYEKNADGTFKLDASGQRIKAMRELEAKYKEDGRRMMVHINHAGRHIEAIKDNTLSELKNQQEILKDMPEVYDMLLGAIELIVPAAKMIRGKRALGMGKNALRSGDVATTEAAYVGKAVADLDAQYALDKEKVLQKHRRLIDEVTEDTPAANRLRNERILMQRDELAELKKNHQKKRVEVRKQARKEFKDNINKLGDPNLLVKELNAIQYQRRQDLVKRLEKATERKNKADETLTGIFERHFQPLLDEQTALKGRKRSIQQEMALLIDQNRRTPGVADARLNTLREEIVAVDEQIADVTRRMNARHAGNRAASARKNAAQKEIDRINKQLDEGDAAIKNYERAIEDGIITLEERMGIFNYPLQIIEMVASPLVKVEDAISGLMAKFNLDRAGATNRFVDNAEKRIASLDIQLSARANALTNSLDKDKTLQALFGEAQRLATVIAEAPTEVAKKAAREQLKEVDDAIKHIERNGGVLTDLPQFDTRTSEGAEKVAELLRGTDEVNSQRARALGAMARRREEFLEQIALFNGDDAKFMDRLDARLGVNEPNADKVDKLIRNPRAVVKTTAESAGRFGDEILNPRGAGQIAAGVGTRTNIDELIREIFGNDSPLTRILGAQIEDQGPTALKKFSSALMDFMTRVKAAQDALDKEDQTWLENAADKWDSFTLAVRDQLRGLVEAAGDLDTSWDDANKDSLAKMKAFPEQLADTMTDAFMGMISGAESTSEAFDALMNGFLESIARTYADMAMKNLVSETTDWISGALGLSVDGKANGGVWEGGFQAFANGGIVSNATFGLVGEGRYNEAIIPMPNGQHVPVEMKGGGQGEVHHHHYTINAIDSQSFNGFLQKRENRDALHAATQTNRRTRRNA